MERKGGVMTTLGREIKKARAEQGLKQKDLHALTGITQKYLSRIENDKADPSFSLVVRIAQALNMPLDPLLCKAPPFTP
jgi:transcriptional regulator with XRE-family HTH domain